MSNVNFEYYLNFNNVDYVLYLSTVNDSLKIHLEKAEESLYWKIELEAKYIEEMTNKAGSYKSFPVFLKMFMSALAQESNTVFVDLMSYKDLEQMRMKKTQMNSLNMSSGGSSMNDSMNMNNSLSDPLKINKKYFIMSYTNEFEKVHYPLPLQFLPTPEPEMLLKTIERMRKIISNKNSNSSTINIKEIEEVKQENLNLKNKIKLLESNRKMGAVENEEFIRSFTGIKDEYENYKQIAENKIRFLAQTIEDLKAKVNSQNANNTHTVVENSQYIKELESKLEKASEIVITERKQGQSFIDEKIREIDRLQKELHFMKENEKKLKVKINQLEKDLDIANKKNIYNINKLQGGKSKLYNSTPKSNYSYKSNSIKSVYSNVSSKKSAAGSTTSNIKKNLQANPYNKFKGLYNKNYSPFKFFDKNKTSSNKSNKSVKSNSSVISGGSNISSSKKNFTPYKKTTKPSFTKPGYNIPKVYTSKNKSTTSSIYSKQKVGASNFNKGKSSPMNSTVKTTSKPGSGSCQPSSNNNQPQTNNYLNIPVQNNSNSNKENELAALVDEKAKIVNRIKMENDSKLLNSNDINQRLGRIQNLLDSAKI